MFLVSWEIDCNHQWLDVTHCSGPRRQHGLYGQQHLFSLRNVPQPGRTAAPSYRFWLKKDDSATGEKNRRGFAHKVDLI